MKAPDTGRTRTARINLSGSVTAESVRADGSSEFPILVLSPRPCMEKPDLLPTLKAMNPSQLVMIYYSIADAWRNWEQHPTVSFEHQAGQLADQGRHWAALAGMSPRQRGKVPAVNYWPQGALVNCSQPGWGEGLAEVVAEFHTGLQLIAGKPLGIYLDNVWDSPYFINALTGNEPGMDLDCDGVADTRGSIESHWADGTAHICSCIRVFFPDHVIIGNGNNTMTKQLNGRCWENLGTQSWVDWQTVWQGMQARDGFRKPVHHILHGTTDFLPYVVGMAHQVNDAWAAASPHGNQHSSQVWDDVFSWQLGRPSSIPSQEITAGIWSREYEGAMVNLHTIELAGTVEMKHGGQWPQKG